MSAEHMSEILTDEYWGEIGYIPTVDPGVRTANCVPSWWEEKVARRALASCLDYVLSYSASERQVAQAPNFDLTSTELQHGSVCVLETEVLRNCPGQVTTVAAPMGGLGKYNPNTNIFSPFSDYWRLHQDPGSERKLVGHDAIRLDPEGSYIRRLNWGVVVNKGDSHMVVTWPFYWPQAKIDGLDIPSRTNRERTAETLPLLVGKSKAKLERAMGGIPSMLERSRLVSVSLVTPSDQFTAVNDPDNIRGPLERLRQMVGSLIIPPAIPVPAGA